MRVVFRVDASTEIGTGHVMRCLTLAQALRSAGHACRFISRNHPGNLADRIVEHGFDCALLRAPEGNAPSGPPPHAAWAGVTWEQDAAETRAALGDKSPDWLVLDHYAFDARWERAVLQEGTRLLVIDDLADRPHIADLLLDQNLGREAADYDALVPPHCRRLIGPRYALLRPEFAEKRAEALAARAERAAYGVRNLLISMGGVDLLDATSVVLQALPDCPLSPETRITVVMGSGSPAPERVRALVAAMPWPTEVLVDVQDMARLMAEADLAIGAAGSTSWERCCLGLPTLTIAIAENQSGTARVLANVGATIDLGPLDAHGFQERLSRAIRESMSVETLERLGVAAAAICDGDGNARLLAQILTPTIAFRPAIRGDSRRVWEWRRQGDALRFNRNQAEPAFPQHHDWFCEAIVDSQRRMHIAESGSEPIGYVRLDRIGEAVGRVSICLSGDARRQGLSISLLRHAAAMAVAWEIALIVAEIHPDNTSSIGAFAAAGYRVCSKADGFLRLERRVNVVA
jgi:UDP-2,4-diacetamido-2,4,6-trideoxy-beta-L-altropyranose hydrolase